MTSYPTLPKIYKHNNINISISFRTNFMIPGDQFRLPDALFFGGIF